MPGEGVSPWLALLRQLDSVASDIGVWKNANEALSGHGDVDYFAPRNRWAAISAAFRSWADDHGFESLPPCLHRPGAMYLLAVDHVNERLWQLDVRESLTSGGSDIIDAPGLGGLLVETGRGFKALPMGSEATLKLLLKCIDAKGLLRSSSCVAATSGIAADLTGALDTCERLFRGREPARRLITSVAAGDPDPSAARSFRRAVRWGALRRPRAWPDLALYRLRRRWCPALRWILSHGQHLPPQADRWIAETRRVHSNAEAWLQVDAEQRGRTSAPGLFLVIAGPDGVGKTTFRDALTNRLRPHLAVWSGRMSGPLTELQRSRKPRPANRDHPEPRRAKARSILKVLYLYADALLRWYSWTRSWLKDGGWVITERGWWDIAVYPARYRLEEAGRFHKVLGALGPRPDLILVLEADSKTILSRKEELAPDEVRRQTSRWRSVIPPRQAVLFLEATLPPRTLVEMTLQALEEKAGISPIAGAPE